MLGNNEVGHELCRSSMGRRRRGWGQRGAGERSPPAALWLNITPSRAQAVPPTAVAWATSGSSTAPPQWRTWRQEDRVNRRERAAAQPDTRIWTEDRSPVSSDLARPAMAAAEPTPSNRPTLISDQPDDREP